MKDPKLGVALTKCYYCQEDSDILINRILTTQHAKRVEKAHGKIVNMVPCSKCQEYMEAGIIFITISDSQSDKDWKKEEIPNPHRTGGWFVIRDEAVSRMPFSDELKAYTLEKRWAFIEHEAAEKLGFFEAEVAA